MYEDKFGTEEDPIVVPSLESERIIGVTDPEDETLVVWGILKENEAPRQFIEGGEFYILKTVEYIKKVGLLVAADCLRMYVLSVFWGLGRHALTCTVQVGGA